MFNEQVLSDNELCKKYLNINKDDEDYDEDRSNSPALLATMLVILPE